MLTLAERNTMKKYEKLLIILAVAWAIGRLTSPPMYIALAKARLSSTPISQRTYYDAMYFLYAYAGMLPQILITVWMFIDAKKRNLNRWIWGAVGLGLGVNGAVLYIALQILEAIRQKNYNGSQQAGPGYPPQGVGSPDP